MWLSYTLCLKKRTNFEVVWLEIIRINFDDNFELYRFKVGAFFWDTVYNNDMHVIM